MTINKIIANAAQTSASERLPKQSFSHYNQTAADKALRNTPPGTYIVRATSKKDAYATLSFRNATDAPIERSILHVRINKKQGALSLTISSETFKNIDDLIRYYKNTPVSDGIHLVNHYDIQDTKTVPLDDPSRLNGYCDINENEATKILLGQTEGTYILRPSSSIPSATVLSLRTSFYKEAYVSHRTIHTLGNGNVHLEGEIQTDTFPTISALIEHYTTKPTHEGFQLQKFYTPRLHPRRR